MNDTWDIARLNSMISSRIEESLSLEYKAAGAFTEIDKRKRDVRTEITKDVSAMANSSGGRIIYGMAEHSDRAKRHLPERIDPILRATFPKEWLEHVISNIKPRIELLRIFPVEIPTNPDHVVYVVEIPQSTTAHQALDFRYYRRYNFESVAMHDYEIRDVMNRRRFPTLSVSASIQFDGGGFKGTLHFEIRNTSDVLAKHFAAFVHVPLPLKLASKVMFFKNGIQDELEDGSAVRLTFSNSGGGPLFPKSACYTNFEFGTVISMDPVPKKTISDIRYRVYADAMPFIEGRFDPDKILKAVERT
jgi:hypothetical protein